MSDETMEPTRAETKGSRHQWCRYAGPGRGDCEHSVGVPETLTEDNTDEYGIPDGWCDYCWLRQALQEARAETARLREALRTLVDSDKYVTHTLGGENGQPCACYAHTAARKALRQAGEAE